MAATTESVAIPETSFSRMVMGGWPELNVLIWAQTKPEAEDVDQIMKKLLVEYGYDPEAPKARTEFEGTYFIRYRFSKRTPDLEQDLEVFVTNQKDKPPEKELPAKKRDLLEKLKKKLEVLNGVLIVGALLFANVAAAKEMYKSFVEAAGATPPPVVTAPAPPRQITTVPPRQITAVPLPPAMGPILETADKDPKKFELLVTFVVGNHVACEEHARHRQRHPRKHSRHTKPKPESPAPPGRGPLGTQ
jgi:hypothetical protein